MRPIVLLILLEYSIGGGKNIPSIWTSPAALQIREWMRQEGLVENEVLSERGAAWLRALLSVPVPLGFGGVNE